ncbi:MAG: patatin-like phospholipase family protein [Nitrospirota bacterium]|nr:MAG: patatin-like phospholipase family protein [Nitrospirota bacterium]
MSPRLSLFRRANSGVLSALFILNLLLVGCGTVPPRTPLTEELSQKAAIPGIPKARIWGDEAPDWAINMEPSSPEELNKKVPALYGTRHDYLALSGGGAKGAFAVGLLLGWSESGTRPEFEMVTGVSTGALIAPFAFLGPEYDATLKEIYTGISTKDIFTERNILIGLTSDAMTDSTPLLKLIQNYVTPQVMNNLATEFRKGRQLNVATTNLDAGRPVIWNLGEIAASGEPRALELIHKILLASASIPVAFPPVLIEVEAEGRQFDELHIDGGGASQVYLYPLGIDWRRVTQALNVQGTPNVYLIRNDHLDPEFEPVEPKVVSIASRSLGSLIRSQGIGDMYRVYLGTQRDGINYHLAYIPNDFREIPKEPFDREYMIKLFNLGYNLAKKGYEWKTAPPGVQVK